MRIDAHVHFWRMARGDYGWLTPDFGPIYRDFAPADAEPHFRRHGITGAVLVQAAPTVAETEFMLEIARATPTIKAVVGWADLEAPDAPEVIARLSGMKPLVGLRPMIQDIPDPEWMLKPALGPGIAAMQRHGLRFDALLKPPHLAPFLTFRRLYPDLAILIDHGAKPEIRNNRFDDWERGMTEIARDERIYCKLSGLATEAKPDWRVDDLRRYVDHLLASFGPRRLVWGSDWPVVNLAGGYDRWIEAAQACLAGLSAAEQADIFGNNAARFYGIAG